MRRSLQVSTSLLASTSKFTIPAARIPLRTSTQLRPTLYSQTLPAVCSRPLSTAATAAAETEVVTTQTEHKTNRNLPSKQVLLRIDWMLEHLLPRLMKARLNVFFDMCKDKLEFEDRIYNYKLSSSQQLLQHIAKIRLYYRWKSPYNKIERIGSCVYEGEDVIVLLWRFSSLESSFLSYFPSFITKKEQKINVAEGALDIHVNGEGHIYKVVNRKITASDLEASKVMEEMKKESEAERTKEEEKEMKKELEQMIEDEKRRG